MAVIFDVVTVVDVKVGVEVGVLLRKEVEDENEETGRIFWTTEWKASDDGSWEIGKTEESVEVVDDVKTIGDVENGDKLVLEGDGENLTSGSCLTMPR